VTRARAGSAVLWATVAALVLRLAVASFDKFPTGDERWYLEQARRLVSGEDALSSLRFFLRPPGMALWVAGLLRAFGDSLTAVRVVHAVVAAATPWLVAAIARSAFPRMRRLPAVAAWVQALNPLDVATVQWVLSENLATPLSLLVVLTTLRAARRPTWGRVLAVAGCTAALMHVRVDGVFVTVGAGLGAVGLRAARRGWRRAALGRWAAAGAVTAALCVPWSLWVSSHLGRPTLLVAPPHERWPVYWAGWMRWLAHADLERTDWLRAYWWSPAAVDPAWLPPSVYASPDEEREVLALLARARAHPGEALAVDAEFERLAAARREASPLRAALVLPAKRTLNIWFDPFDSDVPRHMQPVRRSPPSWALEIALRIARPLAGLGLVAALAFLFRPRLPSLVPAAAVVVRSVAMIQGVPLVSGLACYEARYMAVVQPLALLLAAAASLLVAGRLARARGDVPRAPAA
jgi:hypothetical protein